MLARATNGIRLRTRARQGRKFVCEIGGSSYEFGAYIISVLSLQFRGPGHELGDLRRLLEMYQRWQHRLMPTMPFDNFVSAAEHLSGTHSVRAELHEMRMGLLK
ncbi:hypothetical protein H632_c117p0, partial [Helicosporidium sp. ATCC 50920]